MDSEFLPDDPKPAETFIGPPPLDEARGQPTGALRAILTSALPWCAGLLLLCEILLGSAFRQTMQIPPHPTRNVHLRFNWPQYVRKTIEEETAGPRIVVLGNSQTYGNNIPADRIWTAVLESDLHGDSAESADPARILNWGIMGASVEQMTLLDCFIDASVADRCLVFLTWASLHSGNQHVEAPMNPRTYDLVYLLGEPEARDAPDAFLRRHLTLSLRVELAYEVLFPTHHYRRLPFSWLASNLPRVSPPGQALRTGADREVSLARRLPLFTSPEIAGWYHDLDPRCASMTRSATSPIPGGMLHAFKRQWTPPPLSPIRDFVEKVAASPVPHTLILMPVCNGDPIVERDQVERIARFLEEQASAHGMEVLDWSNLLPPECFYDPFHLNVAGHRALAARVRELLTTPTGAAAPSPNADGHSGEAGV